MKLRYSGTEKGQAERMKISGVSVSRGDYVEVSQEVGTLLLEIGGFERADAPPKPKRKRKGR